MHDGRRACRSRSRTCNGAADAGHATSDACLPDQLLSTLIEDAAAAKRASGPVPALVSSRELEAFGVSFPGHRVEMWFGAAKDGGVPLEYFESLPEVGSLEPLTGELLAARDI